MTRNLDTNIKHQMIVHVRCENDPRNKTRCTKDLLLVLHVCTSVQLVTFLDSSEMPKANDGRPTDNAW